MKAILLNKDFYRINIRSNLSILSCLYFILCSCGDTPRLQPELKYFVPQKDNNGGVQTTVAGDTIWHKVPAFNFIDENGNRVDETIMENNIVVVDFFFTTCPSICVAMSQNLGLVQEYYKNKSDILILSHSVNPEYDTPEVLKKYAENHKADPDKWKFLTGSKENLYRQARNGYFITAIDGNDGGVNDFIHSEKIVLIDKERNIRGFFRGTVEEDITELIESIEILSLEYEND